MKFRGNNESIYQAAPGGPAPYERAMLQLPPLTITPSLTQTKKERKGEGFSCSSAAAAMPTLRCLFENDSGASGGPGISPHPKYLVTRKCRNLLGLKLSGFQNSGYATCK